MSARTPKPAMIIPDPRLTQTRSLAVSLTRSKLTALLKMSHQSAEPQKTPATSTTAETVSPGVLPRPTPAKMAAKERIVVGLVSVSRSVEA